MSASDAHAGDLLSALVDGELDDAAAGRVRDHVGVCDVCARELDDVRTARRLVRELPAVEPPAGFLDSLLVGSDASAAADVVALDGRPRRRRLQAYAGAAVGVAASVAVATLVLTASDSGTSTIEPDLEVAVDKHDQTVQALRHDGTLRGTQGVVGGDESIPATTAPRQPLADIDEVYVAPEEIPRYELVEAYVVDGGVHLLYRRGIHTLSVFEREGEIDWEQLPSDGRAVDVGIHRAWRWDDLADGVLLVIDGDDTVVTVVGDDVDDVLAVAAALDL